MTNVAAALPNRPAGERVAVGAIVVVLLNLATFAAAVASTSTTKQTSKTAVLHQREVPAITPTLRYPDGISDRQEPSGLAPPAPNALAGYVQSYVEDFKGSSLPAGWMRFSGQPGADPGALWTGSHVVVGGGLLHLETFQDPTLGNQWVAGGVVQRSARTYGAFFVRSRTTGPGPTVVQLLWPEQNVWPPEIDFDETNGTTTRTSATVHWGSANHQAQRALSIDMTSWHTWGIIWTPTSVTYTVDGHVWGHVDVASEVPQMPMTLDLDQQTWCTFGYACPTSPQSELVDWVAEYKPT